MIEREEQGKPTLVEHGGKQREIMIDLHFTDDLSCLRHGEHLANSGFCGCSRDDALRKLPPKPDTVAAMKELVKGGEGGRCRELSCLERDILSHNPVKGESVPRPGIAKGCKFGHDPFTAAVEYEKLLATERELVAVATKKGKQKFTAWRMIHAWKGATSHMNVPPGLYGKPLLRHHFRKQILDALHLAMLGLPKTPWKWGIKNNASDDARELISNQLKTWKHPLDMRTKGEGRARESKWFTGEAWASFCAGKCGSPGGPIAIATIVMIIADDLTRRGVDRGNGEGREDSDHLPATAAVKAGQGGRGSAGSARAAPSTGRGRGRAGFATRMASRAPPVVTAVRTEHDPNVLQASRAQLTHTPSAAEAAADQTKIQLLHKVYGSRAQTIINILLAFDAYFAWFYPFRKSVSYGCSVEAKEVRALSNCRSAIDMQESFERLAAAGNGHGSFLPHAAVYKVTRDILEVGDVWAHDLSALELQNAESKRVFEKGGARHLEFSSQGTSHKTVDGETRIIQTVGYGSTAASSGCSRSCSQPSNYG